MPKIEAYICCLITNNGDTLVRLATLGKGASVNISVIKLAELKEQIENGVEMPGLGINDAGALLWHNVSLSDAFPMVRYIEDHKNKVTLLRGIYHKDGMHEAIILSDNGKLKKVFMSKLLNSSYLKVTNVQFRRVRALGLYATGQIEDEIYAPFYPDDKMVETVGITQDMIDSLDNSIFDEFMSEDAYESAMLSRRYHFVYRDRLLKELDSRIDVLNVPIGATTIDIKNRDTKNWRHSESKGNGIQEDLNIKPFRKILIPRTVTSIKSLGEHSIAEGSKVELIYQDGREHTELDASGLNQLIEYTGNHYILDLVPRDLTQITNLFNSSRLADLDLRCLNRLNKLGNSYIDVKSSDEEIKLPESIVDIYGSFHNVEVDCLRDREVYGLKPLILTRNIKSIYNSFMDMQYTPPIDFSQLEEISGIDSSFNRLQGLKEVDLSNCKSLASISGSFRENYDLVKVILPPNLRSIYSRAFMDCPKLEHIELPDSLRYLPDNFASNTAIKDLTIPKNVSTVKGLYNINVTLKDRETLGTSIFDNYGFSFASLKFDSLKTIEADAFTYCNLAIVVFPNSVKNLHTAAFRKAKHDGTFDMKDWNAEIIPDLCFEDSAISKIILPFNTRYIGDNAFKESHKLRQIMIPSKVENIGKSILSSAGRDIEGGTEVYVVEGTVGEKYARRLKLRYRVFSTDEEAYDAMYGKDTLSSKNSQIKAKLIAMGSNEDPVMQDITSEAYVHNFQILLDIYRKLNKMSDSNIPDVKLDMSKIKGLYTVKDLSTMLHEVYKDGVGFDYFNTERMNKPNNQSELSRTFKIISNLITLGSANIDFIKSLDNLKQYLIFTSEIKAITQIYDDAISGIYVINTLLYEGSMHQKFIDIILIRIGTNIVYVTASLRINSDVTEAYKLMGAQFNAFDLEDSVNKYKNIGEAINVGDVISLRVINSDSKINNVRIPKSMNELIRKSACNRLTMVCKYVGKGKNYATLIDKASNTIYSCYFESYNNPNAINDLDDIRNITIIDICDINNLSKNAIKLIRMSMFEQKDVEQLIKQSFGNEYILENMANENDAYDALEPSLEWEISKLMQDANISKVEDLTYTFMLGIMTTAYFKRVIKHKDEIPEGMITTLKDGSTLHVFVNNSKRLTRGSNIVGYIPLYVSYLQKQGEVEGDEVTCFISNASPSDVVKTISTIYDEQAEDYGYIIRKEMPRRSFTSIWESNVFTYTGTSGIYINGKSGGVYYCFNKRGTLYPIFRFKNLTNAVKYGKFHYDEGMSFTKKTHKSIFRNLEMSLEGLLNNDYDSENRLRTNGIGRVYLNMLTGLPSSYKMQGDLQLIWELIAKQPKQP